MKLSVVIPTIGRTENLINTIKDLIKQEFDLNQWECLVISQTYIDPEYFIKVIKERKFNIRVYNLKVPNASLARNIGLIESKGEIVLFLDDDIVIKSKKFLLNHIRNYAIESIPGVAGQITDVNCLVRNDRHKWSYKKNVGWLFFPPNFNERVFINNGSGGNLSVRKKFAINVNGMDINFIKGAHREESDFCLRLTHKYGNLVFDPEASVVHLGVETGGNRSWGSSKGIHKFHNIMGEWYFIFNGLKNGTIKLTDIHYHLFVLAGRQIFNKENLKNPFAPVYGIIKSIFGAVIAGIKILKRSQTINNYPAINYNLLFESKI